MEKFGKSQSFKRSEDVRFLTGHGRYVDDIAPDGALHAILLRSPVAHATITTLDVSEAREAPGVHLVLTVDDLLAAGMDVRMDGAVLTNRDGSKAADPERPMLARGKLRHVGEPVALVVAETIDQARDAAELIELDYDELPAHVELAPGGETIHPEAPDNRAFDWGMGDEAATAAAFEAAARTVRLEVGDNRVIVNAMEGRGCYAEWDGARIHVAFNGQGVWDMKSELAHAMGLDEGAVRITNPDVGGGFGMKAASYPEYFCVAQAARVLGRPVRWMSERTEGMLSDHAGRDLVTMAELAFDADNRITGYRIHTICNLGAYNSGFGQPIQTQLFSKVLTGTYDIPAACMRVEGIYTNTTQVDAYRGAGRPEAIYVLERVMDRAARELGLDPSELRRINFIKDFPYTTPTGETYDVGDFPRVLDHAIADADVAGFAARRAESEAQGKLRGLGLCFYIESILGDPAEDVKVAFTEDGGATIYVGTQSNGQGHETVFAKFLSDQTGIPFEKIGFVQGDSDLIARGGGTGGSRSVTTQANVTLACVNQMVEGFSTFLAEEMGVDAGAVAFDDERFRAEGSNLTPTMLEVADMARAKGREDLLTWAARDRIEARSYPNGAHFAEVEIDRETGVAEVVKYTVVDDFGNLINPMLAEGQVHGGVAQGLGQALCERVVFDEDGQLLSATFMDYAMPRADDVPFIRFDVEPVPSTGNPMGMKGCGEAGTVGALAAVSNAVQDALWPLGVKQVDMPFTPMRLWNLMQGAPMAAE
ncbi:MAG: xanthine dehydrogenase family protein molybdopterin-binding subunit [Rhodobacteraceae bacterium]|jgi:carbon-monoxide dehydrogenase large subunit|uniref:Carbon-monoxide dehydrogenase large subunit n=1 Tax=Salipiger profundus TaxID=1229727 RepID=A0A1U7D6C9_9RHOB|nr:MULTISPECIES: xanthine dehydrogenase family protein molybdopterin-binding subunit [Salipiger]APX23737.1 carbon-monoxide dehydrogenase large subunit [Salipiger profundus]MAB07104.1 xanthine dehydrogenase family protein molybdopterin-binding subunit [Paracoccaceae bacterium]GGA17604.1 carbon monoxide dehydrogenase [Salipiger profundus]SFD30365.1 carbon-monoxide dehydrogenase large subunit [Salipiger profundus]